MKKFILFAFLLLSTISFASNSIVKTQEKNVTTIETVNLTSLELQTAVFEIMPGQICITTVHKWLQGYEQDSSGQWWAIYHTFSTTYCG
jgi:hypothetical protein